MAVSIFSIVVLYKTDLNIFKQILAAHLNNFSNAILVNNSQEVSLESLKSTKVTIINNQTNIGLAAALNVGIIEAKKQGAKMVALFDQDSHIPANYSRDMMQYINNYHGSKPIAVYSSIYHNHVVDERAKLINFKPFRLIRESVIEDQNYAHPHYMITSGSVIPISVFDDVGLMREELFIDFVDIEWCLRARAKGYNIVAINKVIIDHHLGDYAVNIMGHHYPIHSPIRMYYYFRNSIYLYRLGGIDWNWRFVDSSRNLFRFLFYMLFVKNRPTYFKYIIKGYYHGFINKMGKLEE